MSLPAIDQATLPAEIRNGTDEQKQAYTAALGFERMLLSQLTKSLAKDAMGGNEEDSDSGSSPYSDMVASSLADGIGQQGGVGLADQVYRSLEGSR
jgi:Rod binding domain-containing protein